jgi:hypothetical protein
MKSVFQFPMFLLKPLRLTDSSCLRVLAAVAITGYAGFESKAATITDNRDISSEWFGTAEDDLLFWYGLGSDVINGLGGFDTLSIAANKSDATLSRNTAGVDLVTVWGQTLSLVNVEKISFKDGEVLTLDLDSDGVTDYREIADGTDPNDPNSFNPLSKGLVAYYPFNGNANDDSGYGHHGTISGAVISNDRRGQLQDAYAFDGVDDYIEAGNVISRYDILTFSLWFKRSSTEIALPSTLIAKRRAPGGSGVNMGFYPDKPFGASLIQAPDNYAGDVADSNTFSDSEWHHAVFSVNGGSMSAYVDGVQIGTTTFTESPSYSTEPIVIGREFEDSSSPQDGNRAFHGYIDDVRIYNRALPAGDVRQLYYAEAFNNIQRTFLTANPGLQGHFSSAEYNANRTNGQADVTSNPSAFNLFTAEQNEASYTNGISVGISNILSNPATYNLYTSDSIMDLRMGGLMLQKQGSSAVVTFQPQTTTDLTQPFTNNGTPITNTIPMPGNKSFIRIQANPTPVPPQ